MLYHDMLNRVITPTDCILRDDGFDADEVHYGCYDYADDRISSVVPWHVLQLKSFLWHKTLMCKKEKNTRSSLAYR